MDQIKMTLKKNIIKSNVISLRPFIFHYFTQKCDECLHKNLNIQKDTNNKFL